MHETTNTEHHIVVGRDDNGIQFDGEHTFIAESDVFRLYGKRHLHGYYKLVHDAKEDSFVLHEVCLSIPTSICSRSNGPTQRYPELQDGQTGADEEAMWNHYALTKVSPVLAGNPRMRGYQCLHPRGHTAWTVPFPSLWRSQLSSEDDRFYDFIQVTADPVNSCWKYEDVYGNVHIYGNVYAPQSEWDGSLLLLRWDDFTNPDHCYVGSQFVVMLEEVLCAFLCRNKMNK